MHLAYHFCHNKKEVWGQLTLARYSLLDMFSKNGIRDTCSTADLWYKGCTRGDTNQGVLSWRASGDRQISLSASDERAFANFRVKNVVFTGTHFCAVLSMVGERAFVNFRKFVN